MEHLFKTGLACRHMSIMSMTACPMHSNILALRWLSISKHRTATRAVSWLCSHREGVWPISACITRIVQHRPTNIYPRFISTTFLQAGRIQPSPYSKREFHCLVSTNGVRLLSAASKEPKGEKADKGVRKGSEEHGSVLMQFVEKKETPKQLTVGAKGELSGARLLVLFSLA